MASIAGALEVAVLAVASGVSMWAAVPAMLGAGAMVTALLFAAAALSPSLPPSVGRDRLSFLDVNSMTECQLRSVVYGLSVADLDAADSRRAVELSALAMRKYRLLRVSITVLQFGFVLAAASVVVAFCKL
ncbi:Pycsar system effector family protein [Kitasatospora sp. NPDC057542]|uniref:Pycsar system effector family protein n=1 Tax=Streptomycetaceae TaxID=2062 RepID=UPI001CCE25CC|nr:Pycsar system effector family protein [Streptomyces sp. LS1784]